MSSTTEVKSSSASATSTASYVRLQAGLMRENVSLPDSVELGTNVTPGAAISDHSLLAVIRDAADSFVSRRFAELAFNGLRDRLLLFVHDQTNPNILQLLTSASQLYDGVLVEVVLSALVTIDELCSRPHNLAIHNYKSPTFCDLCGEFLWGLIRQGVKCDGCGLNFHKRCAYSVQDNCTNQKDRRKSSLNSDDASTQNASPMSSPRMSGGTNLPRRAVSTTVPATAASEKLPPKYNTVARVQVPHTFVSYSVTRPVVCHYCNKSMIPFRPAKQCKDCHFTCHKKCVEHVSKNCQGEGVMNSSLVTTSETESAESSDNSSFSGSALSKLSEESESSQPDENDTHDAARLSTTSGNIPLMRVVQSIKHTKKAGKNVIHEGWMIHCTNRRDSQRRLHYWRVDTQSVTMFSTKASSRYYKEIQLKDIIRVELLPTSTAAAEAQKHVFEIQTAETLFYIGEHCSEQDRQSGGNAEDNGRGVECAQRMAKAIRQAWLPVTSEPSDATATGDTGNDKVDVETEEKKDIHQLYNVLPDVILGSGQFGVVYGGLHRATGSEVAIKVIDKLRFPHKEEAVLKNEVAILKNLHHPGVVNLQDMFETPVKIYVVMERLKGDMLDMILSSVKGRLDERITRFLIYQVLKALQYLHAKPRSIVHCDLKPENVLLSSSDSFPQVKLCDFGFAKIIGEKSFRRSLVGTPAYLAPEVLKNKCYNRSLDMWSVGVILYVSLSGTFPFNEDEDIADQIQNAAFMYPPDPWNEVSDEAISLIGKLLQVKLGCRYNVDQSLEHAWLQKYQCWCDLRKLESVVDERYLTDARDDAQWESYRQDMRLPAWQEHGHRE